MIPVCIRDLLYLQVLFICPPGTDPLCTMAFTCDPASKFNVKSLIGDSAEIPKVSQYLVAKVQHFIRKELVAPNGVVFHLPIEGGRKMHIKLQRKFLADVRKSPAPVVNRTSKPALIR